MRHPSTPTGNNGNTNRPRNRGAIRTHLGRKRVGPRARPPRDSAFASDMGGAMQLSQQREEALFDRLLDAFQAVFAKAGETTASAFDSALDAACDTLVAAGEFTADNAQRLREYLRRDLLQRDHPGMTFRTGDITTAGTLTCAGCGWTVRTTRTTVLPPCPQCTETAYRKTD
jgi:zinc ribbon family protein